MTKLELAEDLGNTHCKILPKKNLRLLYKVIFKEVFEFAIYDNC